MFIFPSFSNKAHTLLCMSYIVSVVAVILATTTTTIRLSVADTSRQPRKPEVCATCEIVQPADGSWSASI